MPYHPLEATRIEMVSIMERYLVYLDKQPTWLMFLVGFTMAIVIGCLDYLTGEFSLLFLYYLPIWIVTWYVGCKKGMLLVLVCGFARFMTYHEFTNKLSLLIWNSFTEMALLLTVSLIFSALKTALDR